MCTVRCGSDMSEKTYRDTSGRTLADYPRPSVAVDTAVLTLDPEQGLVVLEVRRPHEAGWALPGTFLHEGEVLADAVDRSLRDKANVRGLHPRQLHVFDDPNRDDRGWVLSVAHVDVVRLEQLESRFADTTRLVPSTLRAAALRSRRHHHARRRAHPVEIPRPPRSRSSPRRRIHSSRAADRARGRRRPSPAARHVPSGYGTAPRPDRHHDDRYQGTAG